ncbi:MAG: glycine cleavage system protein H [Candidatus Hodarchaeales archaeon]
MSKNFFEVETTEPAKYVFPLDRYYWIGDTPHVWAKPEGEGMYRLGFDQFAQRLAGPILYARTRTVGKKVKQGKTFGTIETAKWVGPLRSPFTGELVKVNEKLRDQPELVNNDPYNEGWVAKIKVDADLFEEEKSNPDVLQIGNEKGLAKFMDEELEKAGFKKKA